MQYSQFIVKFVSTSTSGLILLVNEFVDMEAFGIFKDVTVMLQHTKRIIYTRICYAHTELMYTHAYLCTPSVHEYAIEMWYTYNYIIIAKVPLQNL